MDPLSSLGLRKWDGNITVYDTELGKYSLLGSHFYSTTITLESDDGRGPNYITQKLGRRQKSLLS
jgi:hypothetical protein